MRNNWHLSSCGDKWLTKTPVFSLFSIDCRSSKDDMAWYSVLCCFSVFLVTFPWKISNSLTITALLEKESTLLVSAEPCRSHTWSNDRSLHTRWTARTALATPKLWPVTRYICRAEFRSTGALPLSKASFRDARLDCTASNAVTRVFGFGFFFWDSLHSLWGAWLEFDWGWTSLGAEGFQSD